MDASEHYCKHCGAINQPEAAVCFACGRSVKITERLPELHHAEHLLQQRYRLLEQIGKGGFSAVYKAEDTAEQRHVAIKAISLHGLRPQESIEATDAFHREVQILSDLKHPNLPRVYDHFSDTESWYIVMDFIEGTTLEKRLEQLSSPTLPLVEIFDIALVLSDVLAYLHSRQPPVVFRDLKPANVILTESGRLYLIDFGIARRFKRGQLKDTLPFGSPGYAAPEQYGRAQTTPRTDIYSLGVMLHQLLTGSDPSLNPFNFTPIRAQSLDVPEKLDQLIQSMVAADISQRPEKIEDVRAILQEAERNHRMQRGLPPAYFTTSRIRRPTIVTPPQPGPASFGAPMLQQQQQQQQFAPYYQQAGIQQGQAFGAPPAYASAQAFGAPIPQNLPNHFATFSLIFGTFSIFIPFLLCSGALYASGSSSYTIAWPFVAIISLLLPVLAIVFGHIGLHRANTVASFWASRNTATTGMSMGYILGVLYLLPACFILTATTSYLASLFR